MPEQDIRVSDESLEYVEMLFGFVASASRGNVESRSQLEDLLNCLPDLVYAIDEHGYTALYYAVTARRDAALEVARILMNHGAEPQAVNEQNEGPYYGLQLIDDLRIQREMGEILGLDFGTPTNALAAADDTIAAARKHLAKKSITKSDATLDKITHIKKGDHDKDNGSGGGDNKGCAIMSLTEDRKLADIFKTPSLFNMDKESNKVNAELNPLLNDISFYPMINEITSSNNIDIIVIPKETLVAAYEMLVNILGELYNSGTESSTGSSE